MSVPMKTVAALACLSLAAMPAVGDILTEAQRPLPPMALRVEPSEAGNMLSWQPPLANPGAPLDLYNVYRLANGIRERLDSVSAAQTTYVDGDAPDGNTTYTYFVTAHSANGESPPSNLAAPDYPWCLEIVDWGAILGPDVEHVVQWDCVLPLPLPVPIVKIES